MKIDVYEALYTAGMILLAFVVAIVVTKTVFKYVKKEDIGDVEEE